MPQNRGAGRPLKYGDRMHQVAFGLSEAELATLENVKDPLIPRAAFIRDLVIDALAKLQKAAHEKEIEKEIERLLGPITR